MNKVYELNVYDIGYVREFRWFFSKQMTPNQMLNIAMKHLNDRNIVPFKDNFDSDVAVEMFSARLTPLIYVDFDEVVLDDGLLDSLENEFET